LLLLGVLACRAPEHTVSAIGLWGSLWLVGIGIGMCVGWHEAWLCADSALLELPWMQQLSGQQLCRVIHNTGKVKI
jgi:hypothetical protein